MTTPSSVGLLLITRIVMNAAYLLPPLVGVLLSHSTFWNIFFWVLYAAWSLLLISRSGDPGLVGIQVALTAFTVYLELNLTGSLWPLIVGFIVVSSLYTSYKVYRAQAIRTALSMMKSEEE